LTPPHLELEADLRVGHRVFQAGFKLTVDYVLKPYLGLLYKHLPDATRALSSPRLDVVGQRTLESIAAVEPKGGRSDQPDVESWEWSALVHPG
jgi:hypothetical protein